MILNLSKLTSKQKSQKKALWPKVEEQYAGYIELLIRANMRSLPALASFPLSRNTNLSKLFDDMLDLAFIEQLVGEGVQPSEIVVRSRAMIQAVERLRGYLKFDATVRTEERRRFIPWEYGDLFRTLIHLSLQHLIIRFARRDFKRSPLEPSTLVDYFIVPDMIRQAKLRDRYYFDFCLKLPEATKRQVWLMPLFAFFSLRDYGDLWRFFRKGSCEFPLLLREHYLSFWQHCRNLWKCRRLPWELVIPEYAGLGNALEILVRAELKKTRFDLSCINALGLYELCRIFASRKLPIQKVIDWNENQPVDRLLCLGLKTFLPKVPFVGHQGFSLSRKNQFHLTPTPFEVEAGLAPSKLFLIGQDQLEAVSAKNAKVELKLGPAFRFHGLADLALPEVASRRFLVSLPLSKFLTIQILDFIAEVRALASDIEFWVKPHPANVSLFQDQIQNLGLAVAQGSFYDALAQSIGLVTIGNSTTLIEAAVLGKPSIVYADQDQWGDIPQELAECSFEVHTPAEALEHLRAILAGQKFRYPAKSYFFQPVTLEGVTQFLLPIETALPL